MMTANTFLPEEEVRVLINRAQRGDREAFALVVEQVRPLIHKMARQIAGRGNGAPIEDLVQAGLLAAVRSVPCFRTDAGVKFVSYVGVAARRAILRSAVSWKMLPQLGTTEYDFIDQLRDLREPEHTNADVETALQIRNLVTDHLGDREQYLVGQRFGLDGSPPRTYAELAVATGTSRQNVQQLVERALRRLRTALPEIMKD